MGKSAIKEGERIAKESIIHLLILGSIKLITGIVTGMTVMLADAISTFADILGLLASYFGLRLSRKSADKNFEYGYYKIETFMALVISLGIIYLGYRIFMESLNTMVTVEEASLRPLALTTTIFAIIHSLGLSKKLGEAGRKANSLSLIASAKDKKMDVFAGIAILGSIIANYQNIPYVEGIISAMISVIILKVGIMSTKESVFFLLDYWGDPVLKRKIRRVLRKEKDLVLKIKKLRLRRAGTFVFGEAFLEINPFAGIKDLREELDLLQEEIKDLNPYIKDFAIYTHISQSQKVKVAVPIKEGSDLDGKVASTLPETSAYLFAEIINGEVKNHYIKKLSEANKKPVEFANFLKKENVNILIDNKLKSLVYYNLRRIHHILVYPNFSDINNAKQTLELLILDS